MVSFILILFIQGNPWVTQAVEAPNIEHVIFFSEATQTEVSFHVYLPPSYHNNSENHFPVLYWLHGGGGGLQGIPIFRNYFHNNIINGTLPEMIVVFPWGLPFGMWTDSKNGDQPVETMIMENLIPFVDANYRTIAERKGRIIEGFSMGGYGSARLGLTYPEKFAAFSMLGAGPVQLDFINYPHVRMPLELRLQIFEEVYGSDMDYFVLMSPWSIGETVADVLPDAYPFRNVIGTDDILIHMNRDLRDHWIETGLDFEYIEVNGADHAAIQLLTYLTQNGHQAFYASAFESATTNREETGALPNRFQLKQNYPNPFNPSTRIEFELPHTSVVQLDVFNSIGQHVVNLVQGTQASGRHSIQFNANDLAGGIYLYRLQIDSFVQTRKMVLVK